MWRAIVIMESGSALRRIGSTTKSPARIDPATGHSLHSDFNKLAVFSPALVEFLDSRSSQVHYLKLVNAGSSVISFFKVADLNFPVVGISK
jgi:hypothetical protein